MVSASLDHAVWFHEAFRADEWLLYATDSSWSGGGRGFTVGAFATATVGWIASVAQARHDPQGRAQDLTPRPAPWGCFNARREGKRSCANGPLPLLAVAFSYRWRFRYASLDKGNLACWRRCRPTATC